MNADGDGSPSDGERREDSSPKFSVLFHSENSCFRLHVLQKLEERVKKQGFLVDFHHF